MTHIDFYFAQNLQEGCNLHKSVNITLSER